MNISFFCPEPVPFHLTSANINNISNRLHKDCGNDFTLAILFYFADIMCPINEHIFSAAMRSNYIHFLPTLYTSTAEYNNYSAQRGCVIGPPYGTTFKFGWKMQLSLGVDRQLSAMIWSGNNITRFFLLQLHLPKESLTTVLKFPLCRLVAGSC